MTEYQYEITPVNLTKLELEIEADETIVTTLQYTNYTDPNLSIFFDGELSGEEEISLDSLISSHDGQPPIYYEKFCRCCALVQHIPSLLEPTDCQCCEHEGTLVDSPNTNDVVLRGQVFRQDTEPVITLVDDWCYWYDTNDDTMWIIFKVASEDQRKMEMS